VALIAIATFGPLITKAFLQSCKFVVAGSNRFEYARHDAHQSLLVVGYNIVCPRISQFGGIIYAPSASEDRHVWVEGAGRCNNLARRFEVIIRHDENPCTSNAGQLQLVLARVVSAQDAECTTLGFPGTIRAERKDDVCLTSFFEKLSQ
jgi:hypothetical protein